MPSPRTPGRFRFLIHALLTLGLVVAVVAIAGRYAPWELSAGNLVLRAQRGMTHSFPVPPTGELIEVAHRTVGPIEDQDRPSNVIVMIGDGMGIGQVSSTSYLLRGPRGGLVLETAPSTGLMKTHAGNLLVTDSAASATAMATGFKVPKKAISVLSDGRVPITLFEAARAAGFATGVITTSGLVDATPAGFTAHQLKREHYPEILGDMLGRGDEILIGGDWSDYRKALKNSDFQEELAQLDSRAASAGYTLVREPSQLSSVEGRVLALFPPRGKGGDAHGPELEVVTSFALERLAATGRRFVLLIESEVTDGMGHDNDIAGLTEGVRELDAALAAALSWAEPRNDTLILVTADHDTGGLGIVDGDYSDGVAKLRWATAEHTAQWVPVFAFGPGAEHFTGVIDNTDLGVLAAELLAIEGFPGLQ
jgi:alkaline phosphatase